MKFCGSLKVNDRYIRSAGSKNEMQKKGKKVGYVEKKDLKVRSNPLFFMNAIGVCAQVNYAPSLAKLVRQKKFYFLSLVKVEHRVHRSFDSYTTCACLTLFLFSSERITETFACDFHEILYICTL